MSVKVHGGAGSGGGGGQWCEKATPPLAVTYLPQGREGDGGGGGDGGSRGFASGDGWGDGCGDGCGDGGCGSRQQASLQFAVSLFFFSSHNVTHFFGLCFFPLHNLVTFFCSFGVHRRAGPRRAPAQSFGDGAVSVSLTLFNFKMSTGGGYG